MPPSEPLPYAAAPVLRTQCRAARLALSLLTRIPVGGFPYSDAELRWSSAYLSLVGAAIGGFLAVTWLVAARGGPLVAAVTVCCVSLLLTGALHEDGLADSADALGGGATRERVLAILKDSRIGAFGAAALVLGILLRVVLLATLDSLAPAALILSQCVSRAAAVTLMASLPYVTESAHSKSAALVSTGPAQAAVAVGIAASLAVTWVAAGWLAPLDVLFGCSAAVFTLLIWRRYVLARVGGVTGDFLGAAQQITECALLWAIVIARGTNP